MSRDSLCIFFSRSRATLGLDRPIVFVENRSSGRRKKITVDAMYEGRARVERVSMGGESECERVRVGGEVSAAEI